MITSRCAHAASNLSGAVALCSAMTCNFRGNRALLTNRYANTERTLAPANTRVKNAIPQTIAMQTIALTPKGLFNVLNHFPHPFNIGFHIYDTVSNLSVVGLGTHGVDFTKHFLDDEFQFTSCAFFFAVQ